MDIATSINRTYDPKYTTYRGDGQGRDSYVFMGNGGLVAPGAYSTRAPTIGYQRPKKATTFFQNQDVQRSYESSGKQATVFKYFGDGSGRDSYVISDCGGMIPKYSSKGPQAEFYNSLRQPDIRSSASSAGQRLSGNKFFHVNRRGESVRDSSQPWFSKKVREAIRQSYQAQVHQVRRLSAPSKTARVKFVQNSGFESRIMSPPKTARIKYGLTTGADTQQKLVGKAGTTRNLPMSAIQGERQSTKKLSSLIHSGVKKRVEQLETENDLDVQPPVVNSMLAGKIAQARAQSSAISTRRRMKQLLHNSNDVNRKQAADDSTKASDRHNGLGDSLEGLPNRRDQAFNQSCNPYNHESPTRKGDASLLVENSDLKRQAVHHSMQVSRLGIAQEGYDNELIKSASVGLNDSVSRSRSRSNYRQNGVNANDCYSKEFTIRNFDEVEIGEEKPRAQTRSSVRGGNGKGSQRAALKALIKQFRAPQSAIAGKRPSLPINSARGEQNQSVMSPTNVKVQTLLDEATATLKSTRAERFLELKKRCRKSAKSKVEF